MLWVHLLKRRAQRGALIRRKALSPLIPVIPFSFGAIEHRQDLALFHFTRFKFKQKKQLGCGCRFSLGQHKFQPSPTVFSEFIKWDKRQPQLLVSCMLLVYCLERFSIESRKTKTKAVINHNRRGQRNEPIRVQSN